MDVLVEAGFDAVFFCYKAWFCFAVENVFNCFFVVEELCFCVSSGLFRFQVLAYELFFVEAFVVFFSGQAFY